MRGKTIVKKGKPKLEVGCFVIFQYEGEYFPGTIIEISDNGIDANKQYKITSMTMSGPSNWKWPEKTDICWYTLTDIKEVISPPTLISAWGSYIIPEIKKWQFQGKEQFM